MRLRHALAAFALLLVTAPADAQKAREASPLEIGADPEVPTAVLSTDGTAAYAQGRAVALYKQDAPMRPATPEAMAREFLSIQENVLGLREVDMETVHVREGDAGSTVRFRQTLGGVPVWGTETSVSMDTRGRVQLAFNNTRELGTLPTTPSLPQEAARTVAHAHLGVSGTIHHDETALVVWPGASGARLAWQVRVEAAEPRGDWEAIVDAHTGELLRVADRMVTHHGHEEPPVALPTVQTHPLYSRVDGTAFIFDPDPLTRAGASYGDFGYTDGGDLNTLQLQDARVQVTLRDITQVGSEYQLRGPWAHVLDWDAPSKGIFSQSSPDWSFTRDNDAFEAATVYWHIDNYMRYVNETLGVPALPQAYSNGVQYDPSGWSGNDNSSFSPGSDRLSFGEGCVDDAEDADVIIHELGHGLDDWLSGSTSQPDGLSEGFGDYVALSYTRSLGLLSPSDASYNWVFKWDGHNQCWGGRSGEITTRYPQGFAPHGRGQHWSTALMRVWDVLGGPKTDKAVFEGFAMTSGSTSQPQAAQAVLQAAANLGYSQDEVQVFFDSFVRQGYNGLTMPPVSTEGSTRPLATRGELTPAAPNPFFGTTQVEVRAAEPQRVTVRVYDALGREVAVLMDETVLAGRRYPVTLDGHGLDSGVYVVRAQGESFEASQRVTLVR